MCCVKSEGQFSGLAMQYRWFQVLMYILPLLIAGEASIFSFRLFVATRLNSGPGRCSFGDFGAGYFQ